jgi:glycine/D-amino acid oxidase-like deaminating enzyme
MDDHGFRRSLWHATAPPAPPTGTLEGEQRTDVAVVGAGYTGLSCALTLAEGGARVAVLEAGEIGQGASGRNNGQVIPTLSRIDPDELALRAGEPFVQLVCDSARDTFELIRRHGMRCEAVQNGWVQPAHSPGRVRLAEARAAAWERRGAQVELLDRSGVEHVTGSRFWHGGWQNRTGGKLNALAYCRELARAAIGRGACVHTQSAALSIARTGGRWRVASMRGALVAERVVIATHAYSGALWPGLARSVVPVASYQVASAPLPAAARSSVLPFDHACSDTQGDLYFFRWDAHGRLVTGGALVMHWNWRERLARRIGARVARVFPQLAVPRFEFLWHGALGITLDRLPHVHELAPGVLAWLGCNGRGLALATAIGRELARACLGAPLASLPLPLSKLRPVRGHAIARRLSSFPILLYRYRDRRELR